MSGGETQHGRTDGVKLETEIKHQWIAALKSRKYLQGHGSLRQQTESGYTYCCLGVLYDLAVKAGIVTWGIASEYTLPATVVQWAFRRTGLSATSFTMLRLPNPRVHKKIGRADGRTVSLAELNDLGPHTFDQIAEIIEQQL